MQAGSPHKLHLQTRKKCSWTPPESMWLSVFYQNSMQIACKKLNSKTARSVKWYLYYAFPPSSSSESPFSRKRGFFSCIRQKPVKQCNRLLWPHKVWIIARICPDLLTSLWSLSTSLFTPSAGGASSSLCRFRPPSVIRAHKKLFCHIICTTQILKTNLKNPNPP